VEERNLVRWQIEPLERRRRGVDERIAVALPGLSRRMRAAATRLPAGSPLRRAALTRAVRTGYAATNRDDYAIVVTLKDGQVFRQENFRDWSTALTALTGVSRRGSRGNESRRQS
jgi:hypothetical protein